MAASIGNFTIDALNTIAKVISQPDVERLAKADQVKKVCNLIKQNILFAAAHCLDDINEPEDEILYGSAGYLQTLLLLKTHLKKVKHVVADSGDPEVKFNDLNTRMDSSITKIVVKLVEQTTKVPEDGQTTLRARFPRRNGRGTYYIGGAHGTLGVVYMIIMASLELPLL